MGGGQGGAKVGVGEDEEELTWGPSPPNETGHFALKVHQSLESAPLLLDCVNELPGASPGSTCLTFL